MDKVGFIFSRIRESDCAEQCQHTSKRGGDEVLPGPDFHSCILSLFAWFRYFTSVWVLEAEFAALPRCGLVDGEIEPATNKLVLVVDDLWLPEQLNRS